MHKYIITIALSLICLLFTNCNENTTESSSLVTGTSNVNSSVNLMHGFDFSLGQDIYGYVAYAINHYDWVAFMEWWNALPDSIQASYPRRLPWDTQHNTVIYNEDYFEFIQYDQFQLGWDDIAIPPSDSTVLSPHRSRYIELWDADAIVDLYITADFPMVLGTAYGLLYMENISNLDELSEAPYEGYVERYDTPPDVPSNSFDVGHVYCIRTSEGCYAKFQITGVVTTESERYAMISWAFQPDGTRNLRE